MGSTHLKAIQALPGVELAAVCSVDEAALSGDFRHIQGNLGGPGEVYDFSSVRKYRDLDQAIADPDLDAVDLCLPTHFHADIAIAAMRAGKHVLVEKPMALDGPDADRMAAESERTGRILMTAHVLRFFPAYVALREALAAGQFGPLRSAVLRRRCAAPAWGGWLKKPELSGGGVFDLLIHDVDIALHLFGRPVSVEASGYQDAARGIDVIHAQFFYANGGTVLVSGGWHHPKTYPFSMEYTVVTDGGTFEYSSAGREPALYREDGTEEKLTIVERDGYAAEVAYFVECCQAGRAPAVCPPRESADSVKLTRFMLQARENNEKRIECKL